MKFVCIPSSTIKIILHSRKSILFNEGNARVKKTNPEFDVVMFNEGNARVKKTNPEFDVVMFNEGNAWVKKTNPEFDVVMFNEGNAWVKKTNPEFDVVMFNEGNAWVKKTNPEFDVVMFNKGNAWVKKTNPEFDVVMGSYNGAEICELVGLSLQDQLSAITGKHNMGLYRDDGLAVLRDTPGPDSDWLKKQIIRMFQSNGLQITIDIYLIETEFLDVTLNLNSGKYWPCRNLITTPCVSTPSQTIPRVLNGSYPQWWNSAYPTLLVTKRNSIKLHQFIQTP